MKKALLRERWSAGSDASSWLKAEPCCSMKSARCRSPLRPSCCASWRTASYGVWEVRSRPRSMFACLRQPTRYRKKRSLTANFATTNNNQTRAAEILGISLKTLHNKLKEYGSGTADGAAGQQESPGY